MAEKKKLSVAEILAAARKMDGGGDAGSDASSASEPASTSPPAVESAPEATTETPSTGTPSASAGKSTAKSTSGEQLSVAEMLAMARGETKGGQAQAGGEAESPKPKAAKPTAAKKAPAPSKAAEKPSLPAERMDTASVLAAARGDAKRGPVSKAEAPELLQRKRPASAASTKPTAPAMPERPAYAVRPPQEQVEERRQFVFLSAIFGSSFATGMTLLGTTTVVWTLALARFMFPNVLTEPPSQFKVGPPDDFAPGQVETKFKAQFGIWLVNADYQGEPCIFALSTVCTHLGCTPNWLDSEQKFKCPCHGSGFYKEGINFEGPAPRPLERYAIRVASDGQIEVDKSRKFQEEMGQWQDPASFVPV
jgi:cytochrome b6-f complex iron-sulfur subunit